MKIKYEKPTKRKVFKSLEEVKIEREKVTEEGKLPNYLLDYFDDKEISKLKSESIAEMHKTRLNTPIEKRIEYKINQDKEFWANNKGEILKKKRRLGKHLEAVYEEPKRAEQRVDEERDLTDIERHALVSICEKDLYLFAIRYFPHYLKLPSSELHRYLYKTLSRLINQKNRKKGFKLAIAAPRSNSKSSVVSTILPLWCVCYNKKKFIIMMSDTIGQAEDFLADIKREIEFNAKIAQDFPYIVGKGPTWRQDEIITKNNIKVLVLGTGSKIRGRKFGVDRPDLVVGDDIESSEMVRSQTTRDFVRYEWFNKDVLFAGGEEGSPTDFLVVGTILGKSSLLNALLDPKEYPDWHSRKFSAVRSYSDSPLWEEWRRIYTDVFNLNREIDSKKFFEDHKEEMLEGTDVLWPEGDPYYNLMIYKLSNPSGFASEKQNDAVDPNKIYVTKERLTWKIFNTDKEIIRILNDPKTAYYGALDPSLGKKSSKGDYSCITTIARDFKTGCLLVVDIDMRRRSVDDQIEAILKNHEKYGYRLFGVETNAFQYVVADNLRKISKQSGVYIPIKEIQVYYDKKMRFEGILPLINDGTVIFDKLKERSNQQYNLGIEQLTTFTGEGDEHDDFVDALGLVVDIASSKKFRMIMKSNV
jgi:predicted phage terminase large subunit-like protein